jgi:hypothetical protein
VPVTIVVSLWILVLASRPLRVWKVGLIAGVAGAFAEASLLPGVNTFFNIEHRPGPSVALQGVGFGLGAPRLLPLWSGSAGDGPGDPQTG